MTTKHIHRYPKRRNGWLFGLGCFFVGGLTCIFTILGLYLTGTLLPLVLGVTGVEQVGNTQELFRDVRVQPTLSIPDPVPPPGQVVVNLGRYGSETVNTASNDYTVVTSGSNNTALVSFTESALLDLCRQRTPICRGGDDRVRSVAFDLKPGGMIVYADVFTGFNWQRLGVVTQVDALTGSSFVVTGVDIAGVTYNPNSLPFGLSGSVAPLIGDIEREGNAILRELVVQASGTGYRLQSLSIDENNLTLNMRGL
ncbi:MAG: hypothetical protein GFH27_549395n72 [Chloroflexi bacterium AL-W]|nr:hypothetical protein [Chloroflexi bacterium AL-W]